MRLSTSSARLKSGAILRGGIVGGSLVAIVIAVAGTLLEINLAPWSWSAQTTGSLGRTIELTRQIGILLPFSIAAGIVIALACAVWFEYVTKHASWIGAAIVGLAAGMLAAMGLGLVAWLAFWFSYTYMPASAPLGPYNASWLWLTLLVAGLIGGLTARIAYGETLHVRGSSEVMRFRQIYSASQGRR